MVVLIKLLQVVLALSILVLVHELGHFLFARLFKIRVDKFYLFFNPWFSLFKFKPKNSDTEYGIGWLPLGGYRIGVRSVSGGYFYYAHLSSYEEAISLGKRVSAGDILGFMGNTGYGEEGTSGMFPVHLHLGIYIRTMEGQEISVNPYPVLQCLRKKIRNCIYY